MLQPTTFHSGNALNLMSIYTRLVELFMLLPLPFG